MSLLGPPRCALIDSGDGDTIWYNLDQQNLGRLLTWWSICFYDSSHTRLSCDTGGSSLYGPVPYDTDFTRVILHYGANNEYLLDFALF